MSMYCSSDSAKNSEMGRVLYDARYVFTVEQASHIELRDV